MYLQHASEHHVHNSTSPEQGIFRYFVLGLLGY